MWHAIFAIIIMFCALEAPAGYEYYKNGQKGAYYEYDLAGSPKERFLREKSHSIGHSIKRPAKILYRTGKRGYKGLNKGKTLLEHYLKGSAKNAEQQQKLAQGLADWESILQQPPKDARKKTPQGLLYMPHEAWRLLKYSLYLVGFALPRGLKKGAKNIIYNTLAIDQDS